MEEPKESMNWRKQVDENVKRLQSLLFGADHFLENRDFSSAQVLGLRLIGFLDSHSLSDLDEIFTRRIRREAISKLDTARRSLAPESDRRAFQQAGKDPGCVFGMKGDIDIDKIKNSKSFQALLQQHKGHTVNELGEQSDSKYKLSCKESNIMTQEKMESLYGKSTTRANRGSQKNFLNSKSNSSEDCIVLEKVYHNHHKDNHLSHVTKVEEEEQAHGSTLGTKRTHIEISSPKYDSANSPSCNEEANNDAPGNGFVTARAKMAMDVRQKRGLAGSPCASVSLRSDNNFTNRGYGARSYGSSRRGVRGNFVPPIKSNGGNVGSMTSRIGGKGDDELNDSTRTCLEMLCGPDGELPEKLRNLEPRLIEQVSNEIMDRDPNVRWSDIAGLEHAKKCVVEMVIWPLLRPDIFRGCRSPGKGLLLFGPPGTGKTMIGKAIAGEAKATFFYISASSLTSKWIGEGEKLVRALFGVASCRQPAVIFVDEIDSLLSQRKSEGEHESSRRLKTQFLIEMEGFDSGSEQILLIGATNRPQELDEAARRRLTKRLYIPLPSSEARAWIVRNLLEKDGLLKLSEEDIVSICKLTEGYSGSDMKNLVKDATMGPLREALEHGIEITKLKKEDMRPVTLQDFENALQEVRPSVSLSELGIYDKWNKQFGSLAL
ncbi:AAA domain-containing protein/Vps4_C domain-containing protein [Cephalotus follicularis]|uniref:AAA domain-containing protein/Vps4_C domain-containing protein n=1 Tax=Cephalotus follicularis TaxID=3775 RepID=A0A1Q3B8F8_CEPFO|nr:AAA domain-containing protein/Vps4_C domain-containing protein [Cephalotus follicularis]